MKIRHLLFAAALLAGGACKNNDPAKQVDDRAQAVQDKQRDLNETEGSAAEKRADVAHTSADLANADTTFAVRRQQAVDAYRIELDVFRHQVAIARGMLSDTSLAPADRDNATDKVLTFEREQNVAEQSVDALSTATAAQWDSASTTVRDQMQKLRDSHDDAFSALSADRKITTGVDATRARTSTTTSPKAAPIVPVPTPGAPKAAPVVPVPTPGGEKAAPVVPVPTPGSGSGTAYR